MRGLILLACLGGLLHEARAQSIGWTSGSPLVTRTYDWTIKKRLGGASGTGSATFSVNRGSNIDLAYTINAERTLSDTKVLLSFAVNCPTGTSSVDIRSGTTSLTTQTVTGSPINIPFNNIPFPVAATTSAGTDSLGSIVAVCNTAGSGPVSSPPLQVVPASVVEVRGTATLSDVITWPTWSQYFPTGNWLTTPPTTAVTSGTYPSAGTTLKGSQSFTYTWTISNTLLCFSGIAVTNTATLSAGGGGGGGDPKTYSDSATASISVVNCDVQPTFTVGTPNLMTSLTYAWSQQITPLTSSGLQVPWGGSGTVQAQAVFTRTVVSAVFAATFTLQITNPVNAPIAINNLQLSCPWGGNMLLPCGTQSSGVGGSGFGAGTWLVIPANGAINCMVNNMPIQGSWGQDFNQACTIMTSNWLGTQTSYTGLVLNFNTPTRLFTINNCALWSVTCSAPAGNAFWAPAIGGLPTSQQVCGSDANNAPLPPQSFSISVGGGWVGDGTQPAACASTVTVGCQSSLQLQSTAGTTQAYGGTQSASLSISATPINCPAPASTSSVLGTVATSSGGVALIGGGITGIGGIAGGSNTVGGGGGVLKAVDPIITPSITKTYLRGIFDWVLSSTINPASQPVSQGSPGQLGRYTVTATPQPAPGAEGAAYQIEGVVRVTNPDTLATMRVDEVFAVVDSAAVPLACTPALPYMLGPGGSLACSVLVNYNQGSTPNTLYTRASVVSDVGVRRTVEGNGARFSWDAPDTSGAQGACARVYQAFATNWFDLVQVTGVAPSFNPEEPTTICGATTWTFDVKFTPRDGTPCGPQQVIQTVSASYTVGTSSLNRQGGSTAVLQVTGANCPALPATSSGGSSSGTGGSIIDESATRAGAAVAVTAPAASSTAQGAAGTAASQGAVGPATATGGAAQGQPSSTGLSVTLSGVAARKAAERQWKLAVEPVERDVVLKAGSEAAVAFKVTWGRAQPATEFTGAITVTNNRAAAAEVDGMTVDLLDSMGSGDVVGSTTADCPAKDGNATQALSSSRAATLRPGESLTCNFTLQSGGSGSLVATVTTADGGDASVSKPAAATSLLAADASCAKLVTGLAASELGVKGVLPGTASEEEVCAPGSKVVRVVVPKDAAPSSKSCSYPVVTLAWLRPPGLAQQGAVASGRANVSVAGCVSGPAGTVSASSSSTSAAANANLATATVKALSLTKARYMHWTVEITAEPDVANDTFDGDSLDVVTKWQQALEPGERLSVMGDVMVRGAPGITKLTVFAIPMCAPSDNATADCAPVMFEAPCKAAADNRAAARCRVNIPSLANAPGLLWPRLEGGQPAAAAYYDPYLARWGARPATSCVRLTEDGFNSLIPLDGGSAAAKLTATMPLTATPLSAEPFCGVQKVMNRTLSFTDLECGKLYAFRARAAAVPTAPGAAPVTAELAFNVTC